MAFRFLLALATGLTLASGHASAQGAPKSTYDVIKERGTLIAGLRNDFPPYGYIDKSGEWVGYEIDFAEIIAKKLGVKLEKVTVVSNTRIPLLTNGNVDLVMAMMNPTVERSKSIDFSQPYAIGSTRVMAKKGSGVNGVNDLGPPRKIGAVQGAVNDLKIVQKYVPNVEVSYYQEWTQAALALARGHVDGIATTDTTLYEMQKMDDQLEIVGDVLQLDPAVIGVRQNDSKWRLFLEQTIMESWADGTLPALYKKHMGGDPSFSLHVWPDLLR